MSFKLLGTMLLSGTKSGLVMGSKEDEFPAEMAEFRTYQLTLMSVYTLSSGSTAITAYTYRILLLESFTAKYRQMSLKPSSKTLQNPQLHSQLPIIVLESFTISRQMSNSPLLEAQDAFIGKSLQELKLRGERGSFEVELVVQRTVLLFCALRRMGNMSSIRICFIIILYIHKLFLRSLYVLIPRHPHLLNPPQSLIIIIDNFICNMLNGSALWNYNPSVSQSKQFQLYFTNPYVDGISKTLTTFGNTQTERIVYMGPRYASSVKLIKAYSLCPSRDDNQVTDSQIYGEQEINRYEYACSQKQKYYGIRASEYRLFTGMNPTALKKELRFDSNFECGNLDLAVSLGNNEYDLFMRVDSNTKGHTCWFFFKVTNFLNKQRVKFNVANFSRNSLLYESGMKVYTYCSSSKEWGQEGQNINFYQTQPCRYVENSIGEGKLYTLSFEYQFKIEDQFVYFAYCIPYSYSYLEFFLGEIEKKYFKIVNVDRTNFSGSGLPIPLLTITNKNSNIINLQNEEQEQEKKVCFIIGRLHPGETQASWLLHGFINYVCSPKAKELRNRVVFKIIPMVNVEGVIAGNFRTALLGRDLNRNFDHPQLLNEIGLIRSIAMKFNPFMFLDFHGHSAKKNIFSYGPEYGIDSKYFLPCRLFSKAISKSCKAFRYYACSFRISSDKKSTGRAVMLRNHQVIYCFTVESSSFAFGQKKEEIVFDKTRYIDAGSEIGMGLDKFFKIILALPKRYDLQKELQKGKGSNSKKLPLSFDDSNLSIEDKKLFHQILTDEKELPKDMGLQDSDFENDDYTDKELNKMLKEPSQQIQALKKKERQGLKLMKGNKNGSKSLHSQKKMRVNSGAKMTEPDEPIFQLSKRSNHNNKYLKNLTSQTESQSMKLNVESFPREQQAVNKINIKLPKKLFAQDGLENPLAKLQSLNNVSLDYSLNKVSTEYQPLSEMKRMREKESIMLKKRSKEREKVNQSITLPQSSKIEIKHSMLPLLGRNGNMNKQQKSTLIEQILQNHERSRKNNRSKHIKLFYY